MKISGFLTYPQKYCVMVMVRVIVALMVAVMVAVEVGDQKRLLGPR